MVKARMTMGKKSESARRFCGNCYHHSVYEYPDFIFCCIQHMRHNDPIVPTLGYCEQWKPDSQECFCVEEALKTGRKSSENLKNHCKSTTSGEFG